MISDTCQSPGWVEGRQRRLRDLFFMHATCYMRATCQTSVQISALHACNLLQQDTPFLRGNSKGKWSLMGKVSGEGRHSMMQHERHDMHPMPGRAGVKEEVKGRVCSCRHPYSRWCCSQGGTPRNHGNMCMCRRVHARICMRWHTHTHALSRGQACAHRMSAWFR